ncbi:hypothetical protein OG21DRAFT_1503766 [Imleria badia]|nr:hypothetical protein OG21DRAFT_1503766 [Imleria badia]
MGALDNSFGALLIGVIVASMLYGCTCIQTWYYYTYYPSDRWYIKLLVAGVLVSDSLHQIAISHAIYTYLVTDFGLFQELGHIVWSLAIQVFFNVWCHCSCLVNDTYQEFTTLFVQCFMVMRIYMLSEKNWLATGLAMTMVIVQFLMVFVYGVKAVHFDTFEQALSLKALSMTINVTTAAGDLFISLVLCYFLHGLRSGFRKSNTLINKLITFSISTGLLTSLCAIASLICISAWPHTFIYMTFYFCIGRLYYNTLLTTLNARKGLRDESQNDDISFCQLSQRMTNQSKLGTSHGQQYSESGDTKDPEVRAGSTA